MISVRSISAVKGVRDPYQVHTITSAANQADITDGIKSTKLVERQTLVHKVDGHKLDGSEPSVNPPNEFVDGGPQILILFDILP